MWLIPQGLTYAQVYEEDHSTEVGTTFLRSGLNVQKISKEFTSTSTTYYVKDVSFELRRDVPDATTSSWFISVYKDGSEPEDGTLIATSTAIASGDIPTSSDWIKFEFPTSFELQKFKTYFFVFETTGLDSPKAKIVASANDWEWRYCPGCGGNNWQDAGAKYSFRIGDLAEEISWNYPLASGTYPEFHAFVINYDSFNIGSDYKIKIEYGTASTTINDPENLSNFGWDNLLISNIYWHEWPSVAGTSRIYSGFRFSPDGSADEFQIATGTTYYARAYAYAGNTISTSTLVASTTLISFDFNEDQPVDNYGEEYTTITPTGQTGFFDPEENCVLCTKFPFAYLYDINDAFEAEEGGTEGGLPTLALDYSAISSTLDVGTLTVFSSTTVIQFTGESNVNLIRNLIIAIAWIMGGMYAWSRTKGFFRR